MPDSRSLDVSKYIDALSYNQRVIIETSDRHQSNLCEKIIAANHRKQQRRRTKDGERVIAPKELAVNDWVLAKPAVSYPLHKLAPKWLGPFQVHTCSADSEVVVVVDTLKNRLRKFLRRNLELFDRSLLSDVEGLKVVAETDNFEFPVEAIIGHALIKSGGVGVEPEQLPMSFKRGTTPKRAFQFQVRWSGYDEPSWLEFKVASRLVQFPGYVSCYPNLRMD
jgi:hypothetical protein